MTSTSTSAAATTDRPATTTTNMTNEYPSTLRCYRGTPMETMTAGHDYDASAGKNDCCFEKQCKAGKYQTGVSCMMETCTP